MQTIFGRMDFDKFLTMIYKNITNEMKQSLSTTAYVCNKVPTLNIYIMYISTKFYYIGTAGSQLILF